MPDPAILPCPFCGSEAIIKDGAHLSGEYEYIECSTCPAYMEHDGSITALIDMWNSRAKG